MLASRVFAAPVLVLCLALSAPTGGSGQEADGPPKDRRLLEFLAQARKSCKITAVAEEIGLAVISAGKDDGIMEGDGCQVYRGAEFVASMVVDRVDRKWSAGKVVLKKPNPRVGDDVFFGGAFTVERKKALYDYAFSFHPVTEEERARVTAAIAELENEEIGAREKAVLDLRSRGAVAVSVLRGLDAAGMSSEARARVQDVLRDLGEFDRLLQSPGLERDVEFLLVVDDPRGYERLKRILSGVPPFASAGFPEKGACFALYLSGWWAYSKDRVRWNPGLDRFEPK